MTVFLFDDKKLRQRLDKVYWAMMTRAKAKLWKSGKKKDTVRVPGIERLPFDRDQLWQHALNQVGPSGIRCPYCVAIGRNAFVITLENCVFDHKVPVAHGGTWELDNLVAICEDCNRLKGHLTYPFYIGIMRAIEKWEDQRDRTNMYSCMRTHGVTMRLKFTAKGKAKEPSAVEPAAPSVPMLPLKEDW